MALETSGQVRPRIEAQSEFSVGGERTGSTRPSQTELRNSGPRLLSIDIMAVSHHWSRQDETHKVFLNAARLSRLRSSLRQKYMAEKALQICNMRATVHYCRNDF